MKSSKNAVGMTSWNAQSWFQCKLKASEEIERKKISNKNYRAGMRFRNTHQFEDLSFQEYYAVELRDNMISSIKESFPEVVAIQG